MCGEITESNLCSRARHVLLSRASVSLRANTAAGCPAYPACSACGPACRPARRCLVSAQITTHTTPHDTKAPNNSFRQKKEPTPTFLPTQPPTQEASSASNAYADRLTAENYNTTALCFLLPFCCADSSFSRPPPAASTAGAPKNSARESGGLGAARGGP